MLAMSLSVSVLMLSLVAGTLGRFPPLTLIEVEKRQHHVSRFHPTSNGNGSESVLVNGTSVSASVPTSTSSITSAGPLSSAFENATATAIPTTSAATAVSTTNVSNRTLITTSVFSTSVALSTNTANVSSTIFVNHTSTLIPSQFTSANVSSSTVNTSLSSPASKARTYTAFSTPTSNRTDTMPAHSMSSNHTQSAMPSPSSISANHNANATSTDLRTSSLHAVCKRLGSCPPAPTPAPTHSSGSGNRNLWITDPGSATGTTSAAGKQPSQAQSHPAGGPANASILTVGDPPSTSLSNSTESSPLSEPLSTEVGTSGTSTVGAVTPIANESGLGDPHHTNLVNLPITSSSPSPSPSVPTSPKIKSGGGGNKHLPLIIGLSVGLTLLLCVICALLFWWLKKRRASRFPFNDKVPLDFSKISPASGTKVSFGYRGQDLKPRDTAVHPTTVTVTLPNQAYTSFVNAPDIIDKPHFGSNSVDLFPVVRPDAQVISDEDGDDQFYGIAL